MRPAHRGLTFRLGSHGAGPPALWIEVSAVDRLGAVRVINGLVVDVRVVLRIVERVAVGVVSVGIASRERCVKSRTLRHASSGREGEFACALSLNCATLANRICRFEDYSSSDAWVVTDRTD